MSDDETAAESLKDNLDLIDGLAGAVMIGSGWWANGISVDYHDGEWSGAVDYFDDGWRNDRAKGGPISTEGQLRTRHRLEGGEALTAVVDALVADVKRLGIRWVGDDSPLMPTIYAAFEAAAGNYPDRYPLDWRDLLNAQAQRLGWEPCYLPVQRQGTAR